MKIPTAASLVKPLLIAGVLALYTFAIHVHGVSKGSERAYRGQLEQAQLDAAELRENALEAIADASRNATERAKREVFFTEVDQFIEDFYDAKSRQENTHDQDPRCVPAADFDPDELRLFNHGNRLSDFDGSGAIAAPGEVPDGTPGR